MDRWGRPDLAILPVGAGPESDELLPVENKSTAHLGDTESEVTSSVEEQLQGYDETPEA